MIKMRKLFFKLSMLLFVLGMSTNAAWAGGSFDPSQLPPDMIQTLMTPTYCAQLTGRTSSTGGGKVYVNAPQAGQSVSDDPRETPYVEGESNVAVSGMGMSMAGMTKIGINAWAKADPGYWFAGFSFSNMGTDLGTANPPQGEDGYMPGLYVNTYDIGALKNETIEYVIYGTFEPIRLAGYEITGKTTTDFDDEGNMTCDLAVVFTPSGATVDIDEADFLDPVVTGVGWSMTGWDYNTTNVGKVTVNVHFSTTNTSVAEYSGNLKLRVKSGIEMNVPLNARTAASSDVEAIRYNKNKIKVGEGTLSAMIEAAEPTDVIKLNKNYEGQVVATKSFTLDLNGYNIEYHYNTLRNGEFDEAAIAKAALLVYNPDAVVTIARSPYGGEIIAGPWNDAADVFGKLILNGGTLSGFFGIGSVGVVEQNGATINASPYSCCAIASQGKVTITDGKMNAMVGSMGDGSELIINGGIIDNTVIENPQSYALFGVQIGGGVCRINKGTIIGRQYGVQNAGGEISIEKLAVIKGGESSYALDCQDGTTTVNCGKFEDPAKLWDPSSIEERMGDGRAVFGSGYFQTNNPGENAYWGQHVWRNTSGAEFREGYEFFVGPSDAAKEAGVSVCHIGGTSYSSLEDAIDYANNTSEEVVIIMDNDYTLPAGYYTIPSNATLLIPMSNEQGAATSVVSRDFSYTTPTLFRKLTLESGVNMDVFGTIEVSGAQYSGDDDHTGAVTGDYAQLQMNQGSKMVLQNNAVLRAWGYVTGDIEHKNTTTHVVPMGEIDVRRGATVFELFQMGDWGQTVMNGLGLVSGDSRFPITSYFIQNVEVPAKYHPGGRLTSATTVSASGGGLSLTMCANDIQIIGVTGVAPAMFLMNQEADAENTWVRKWYDASKDQQVYEINSGAHIGNLVINLASSPLFEGLENTLAGMDGTMGTIGNLAQGMGAEFHQDLVMNSGQYVLPITSNFKLHLLSGTLDFTQSTELIPGSELEIDKEAIVYVTDRNLEGVREGSLYIYDWRDWSDGAANGQPAQKILYTPSFDDGINDGPVPDAVRDVSTSEALGHAKVNVHGTFDTYQGYIFTSENGGDIFSSVEDAGTFMFTSPALLNKEGNDSIEVVKLTTSFGGGGQTVNFYPAKLHNSAAFVTNGGEEYQSTGGTEAGQSYCFIDFDGRGGQWKSLKQDDDDACFLVDEDGIYYAKPQEYVAVTSNAEDPVTHTFSDLAGTGRLFIRMRNEEGFCHWWEVEAKENYYHCIHPENDTYYEWDNVNNEWKEKKFTITWKDWDGSTISTYTVSYGTQAEWMSDSPTREPSIDYTYNFTGWNPALGRVTSDVTYTATYEEKQIKYTVIFLTDGGVEVDRDLYARNEIPVCENPPTLPGYTLQWDPQIAAVTGNQTYVATWLPEPPSAYEITFVDYDGTTVLKRNSVAVGLMPTPPANPSGKPATTEYTYVFDHWQPTVEKVSAQSVKTYTAIYREEPRKYTVTFKNDEGTTIEVNEYAYGETPVCSEENLPTKASDAEWTYQLTWTPQIQTVMGDATYTADFETLKQKNKYTVNVKCSPSGAATVTGSGIYEYNEATNAVTIAVTNVETGYVFNGWSGDLSGTETSKSMAIMGNINAVANFTCSTCDNVDIVWMNWDGTTLKTVSQAKGTVTTFPGSTPKRAATAQYTYTFDGWVTDTDYPAEGAFYKNNMTPKAAEGGATYYAHYAETVNQYKITLKSNPAGVATFTGAGTYDYNAASDAVTVAVADYNHDNYEFIGWSNSNNNESQSIAITTNVELTANFTTIDYDVTWKNEDGAGEALETDEGLVYGAKSQFNGAEPTKAADATYTYTFDGWTTEANGEGVYYANGNTPAVTGDATYYAHFRSIVPDLNIANGTTTTLTEDTEKNDLVVTSNGYNASGELVGVEYLTLRGDAYFDLTVNAKTHQWYAVAVPWQVDARTGISVNGKTLTLGTDFDIIYYNGARRAAEGKVKAWQYVEEDGDKTLIPGRLYMIGLMRDAATIRFTKKAGANLLTTMAEVYTYAQSTGDDADANWNGVANPALFKAYVNPGASEGQIYNPDAKTWGVFDFSEGKLVVGQGAFVQAPNPKAIVVSTGGSYAAPRRTEAQASNVKFDVLFAAEGATYADRLFVKTTDEKEEDGYVIGQDLVKFSVSSAMPQMWINRYNQKLCVNTAELVNETAEYSLGISAPAAGTYTIRIASPVAGTDLYLTYNGEAIWNLNDGAYTLTFNKGIDANYGLRISARKTPTGIDEAIVDAQGDTRKVLINNQVFIIRGEKVYSIDGQLVK